MAEMGALEIRMEIKRLLKLARETEKDFVFIGEVDHEDVTIEALIHSDKYEVMVRRIAL